MNHVFEFHSQVALVPVYSPYGGTMLAAETFTVFDGTVPAASQFDISRYELYPTLEAGALMAVRTIVAGVWGAAGSSFYGDFHGTTNHGAGLANGDYRRVECAPGSTGPNIVRKTALRANPGSGYGQWLHSDSIGPNVQASRYITADNPASYGDVSYAIPNIDVIQNNIDVTQAVAQWNVSPGSTGDYLRIFGPNGRRVFSIGKDGVIKINGITLDDYIDARIAAAIP